MASRKSPGTAKTARVKRGLVQFFKSEWKTTMNLNSVVITVVVPLLLPPCLFRSLIFEWVKDEKEA
jgi:hypothetical protein